MKARLISPAVTIVIALLERPRHICRFKAFAHCGKQHQHQREVQCTPMPNNGAAEGQYEGGYRPRANRRLKFFQNAHERAQG